MVYTNDVSLQGIIVNKFVTPKSVVLTINTGNATKISNFPKVVCFGELRDYVVKNFDKGDHVTVDGNVQSSIRNEKNKGRPLLSVFAEKVEFTNGTLGDAFGIEDDKSYKPFVNSLKVAGSVTRIRKLTDNLFNVTIFTRKNGRVSFVVVSHYARNPEEFQQEITVGDEVYAVGNIQTAKKVIGDETRYFQNCVATEIAKQ